VQASAPRLVADVGGTHARFALAAADGAPPAQERTLACADFPSLSAAAAAYLAAAGNPPVREACIAVAGPVTGDRIEFTNRAWSFSIAETRAALRLERLVVVNDFEAQARALPLLSATELRQVGGGAPVADAPRVVLGPGTGLGVAALVKAGGRWIPIPGEGGHVALSPMDPREAAVLAHLWRRWDHVSAERLVSGPGLQLLWETLRALDGQPPRPAPPPEEITHRALSMGSDPTLATLAQRGQTPGSDPSVEAPGSDPNVQAPGSDPSAEALAMFCALLGTVAANLALTLGARGGVYLGGGIVPALGPWFDASPFRARFERKGRFSDYLAAIPAWVITAPNPALRGAATALDEPPSA
jgi:glucokinase